MIKYPVTKVVEGKTTVIVPDVETFRKSPNSFPESDAPVFYNKVMEINRDFALAILRVYLKEYTKVTEKLYCEPMAGTGIRSLRVAFEIDNLKVLMNDRNPHAVQLMKKNVKKLKIKEKTEVLEQDANELLLARASIGEKCHILDIDPFGSPSEFMDSTAQGIAKNGLLAVTSTDMATMCGVYSKACIRKYASKPIHTWIAHEFAIRMQLGFIVTTLARHGKGIKPIFVHSTEHFIRTYIIAEKGITKAKQTMEYLGYVAHCPNCLEIQSKKGFINFLPKECPNCGEKNRLLGGPVWLGKLFNKDFVNKVGEEVVSEEEVYGTRKKMLKMLELIKDEVRAENQTEDALFFYDIHRIADKLNLRSPKIADIIEGLKKLKFVATRTHFRTNSIKTNAPINDVISELKKAIKEE
ncbi:MAG: tRNA (guanine(10)-N(2))-dimethyltransferase [Candidatus Heimdallarchaeota archaeon]